MFLHHNILGDKTEIIILLTTRRRDWINFSIDSEFGNEEIRLKVEEKEEKETGDALFSTRSFFYSDGSEREIKIIRGHLVGRFWLQGSLGFVQRKSVLLHVPCRDDLACVYPRQSAQVTGMNVPEGCGFPPPTSYLHLMVNAGSVCHDTREENIPAELQ